jgi:hypothetical protein
MRLVQTSAGILVLLTLSFPVWAGQKGQAGNHGPQPAVTHGPSAPTSHGPSTTAHGPSTATHGKPVTAPTAKSVKITTATPKSTAPKTVKATKSAAKAKTTTASSTTSSTSTTATTGTTTTPPPIDFTAGSVGSKLSRNSALRSKIESRLTALGYKGTAYQAAYGFKNLGQFVAATNVSRNLGVSFEKLKTQMTGITVKTDGTVLKASLGTDGKVTMVDPSLVTTAAPTKSLGQSIQTVKSNVDATAAATTATTQANAEIQSTSATVSK